MRKTRQETLADSGIFHKYWMGHNRSSVFATDNEKRAFNYRLRKNLRSIQPLKRLSNAFNGLSRLRSCCRARLSARRYKAWYSVPQSFFARFESAQM